MTYSIHDELIELSDSNQEEIKKRLIDMGVLHIFEYPLEKHWEDGWFRPIVLFAAYAYSWESKMIKIGSDRKKEKKRIAEKVKLPATAYPDVVELGDEKIADCFQMFLNLYRDNMDYVHVMSLKDMYQQIMAQSTKFKADEQGNANLDEKFKNIKRANELKEEIQEIEEELLKKYKVLNAAKSEFKYDQTEHGNLLILENSKLIR